MGKTYYLEAQIWKGVPEGFCVGPYRCSSQGTRAGWIRVSATIRKRRDNARGIMTIPGVDVTLK